LFIIILILFTPSVARGQDTPLDLQEIPEAVLTPMEKDDRAPYQGVLLSPDAIANIIAEYRAFGEKLRIELERVQGEADAQKRFEIENLTAMCVADKKILQSEIDNDKRENKILIERQKKLEKANKSVLTWTLVGAGLGVLVTGLGYYGISRLTE
jgi:hypothetical protein